MAHAVVKTSVFCGTSLDGFIARRDGSFGFLPDDAEDHGYLDFFASIDALVIGRNTYEVVLAFPTWPYESKPVFVLSSRPLRPAPAGARVEHRSGDPAAILDELAGHGIRHVYVDGGLTVQRFLAAGLLSRIVVTRVPVLIGDGIPLFGPIPRDIRVRHLSTTTYPSGLVKSEYDVLG